MDSKHKNIGGRGFRVFRRLSIWAGGAVFLVLVVWAMAKLSTPAVQIGTLTVPVRADENIHGPENAVVTIVEYSDFQCPACAAFSPIAKQLFADPDVGARMRLVYRYFPLSNIHANAQLSAYAAQAAAIQGKFWEMHDILFKNQAKWSGQSSADAGNTFREYAKTIGADMERFDADFESSAVKERVQADFDGGKLSGVNSTPSFFINGTLIPHPKSYAELKQSILTAAQNENQ